MTSKVLRVGAMLAVPAAFAASAAADVIASFGYNDLSGAFTSTSATTGMFTANASSTVNLNSSGDVTRLIPTTGTAQFAPGFFPGFGNVSVNVSVTGIDTGLLLASGTGNITMTDADGDTITADIDGVWIGSTFIPQTYFNGALFNVQFNDNGAADGTFDGTSGSFSIADLTAMYEGSIAKLFLNPSSQTYTFFNESFQDVDTQVIGEITEIVPTPGATALVGVAGLMVARRRRR